MPSKTNQSLNLRQIGQMSPAGFAWATNYSEKSGTSSFILRPHVLLLNETILDLVTGNMPEYRGIIVSMPPRHGKSELCSAYLPPWYLGVHPDNRVALVSYEENFATMWGRRGRGVLERYGREYFGVEPNKKYLSGSDWGLGERVMPNGDERQFSGGFLATGVGGPITGRGVDLMVVDDPIKNAMDAHSRTKRENLWQWWISTARTRFEPGAVVVIVMTRWHEDDLAGRLLKAAKEDPEADQYFELRLPALAETNDVLGREVGEALWPERYPVNELLKIKHSSTYFFSAMYQQRPSGYEGQMIQPDKIDVITPDDLKGNALRMVRRWDLAATEGSEGDWTAGVLLALYPNDEYVIMDVIRKRVTPDKLEKLLVDTAASDGHSVPIRIEQERGSSGKILVARYKKLLHGYPFRSVWVTGDKTIRAVNFAAAVNRGDVSALAGDWNEDYFRELGQFDRGEYDDQVDASAGAYNDLQRKGPPVGL